jgi:DNA-binding NtrC family response regulator/pSer/pThr/pTyr-binding forkhead associated (FHA) protein
MSSPDLRETLDARLPATHPQPVKDERLYLLVLEGNSSALYPLPRNADLLIGRATQADIQIDDPSVSRNHARIVVNEGVTHVADLGSHNGVRVNGEPVVGTQLLQSGDVVTLGSVTLVFHCGDKLLPTRPTLDFTALRGRLLEELERVQRYERAASVVALELGSSQASQAELLQTLSAQLRLMDSAGPSGGTQLIILLPEMEGEEAEDTARHLLEQLSSLAPQARAGVATAPQDGLEAETLIAAARSAALAASQGQVRISGPDLYRVPLGERSVVVADAAMVRLFELLRRLSTSTLPVLIHGETGAGKENAAWAVHHWSPRAGRPFLVLNCAAIPENLVESELFGYERGAFSGADKPRAGLLEQAHGGTLFLDEVAELPLPVQAKLLRVLDQKPITRLGDSRERVVDLRFVAATHRVLAEEVKAGRFRQDLFFRLSAAVVVLPPLRDRPHELPLLANSLLADSCTRWGRPSLALSAATMALLQAHSWPGNVRELKNTMEFAATVATGPVIEPSHLPESLSGLKPPAPAPAAPSPLSEAPAAATTPQRSFRPISEEVRELERQRMMEALEAMGGVQKYAAQLIGMPTRTFTLKLKQYKITPRWGSPLT